MTCHDILCRSCGKNLRRLRGCCRIRCSQPRTSLEKFHIRRELSGRIFIEGDGRFVVSLWNFFHRQYTSMKLPCQIMVNFRIRFVFFNFFSTCLNSTWPKKIHEIMVKFSLNHLIYILKWRTQGILYASCNNFWKDNFKK